MTPPSPPSLQSPIPTIEHGLVEKQFSPFAAIRNWTFILIVQRLAAILLLRPGGFFYDFTDYYTYWLYARVFAEGFWPFRDFWMEYSPLFPLFNQSLYALSLYFPPLPDPRFWHHLLLGLSLLPFDVGVMVLLHELMRRVWDAARAEWAVAVWVLLFAPLFLWQSFFDVLPLFGLMLAVWAMTSKRPIWAGVGLAFGFLTKLISILAIPAALWVFARRTSEARARAIRLLSRDNFLMLSTFMVVVGLVIGPLWLMESQWLTVTWRNFGGRGAWQTIWALADGFYGYGQVHGDRFDPMPDFSGEPSIVPWLLVHGLFAVGGLWLWTCPWKWEQAKVQLAFVAVTIFLFHLWSKGWSPQFTLLLLPWILLLLPDGRGIGMALLLTSLMAWETIYFGFVVYRFDAPWMLVTIILLRTIALIVLTGIAIRRLRLWSEAESKD